jgi:hypothetical protein
MNWYKFLTETNKIHNDERPPDRWNRKCLFCMSMRKIFKNNVHVQNHSTIEIKLGWFGMFLRLSAAGFFSMET